MVPKGNIFTAKTDAQEKHFLRVFFIKFLFIYAAKLIPLYTCGKNGREVWVAATR